MSPVAACGPPYPRQGSRGSRTQPAEAASLRFVKLRFNGSVPRRSTEGSCPAARGSVLTSWPRFRGKAKSSKSAGTSDGPAAGERCAAASFRKQGTILADWLAK